jgi:hypothetical protein
MSRKLRVRPSPVMSFFGGIVGLVFVYLGSSHAVPDAGEFGMLWTLGALVITVVSFYNAFSSRGVATEIIDLPGEKATDSAPKESVEVRLVRLDDLKAKGLISPPNMNSAGPSSWRISDASRICLPFVLSSHHFLSMKLPALPLSLLLLVLLLSGCSRDSGLLGKWTFDRQYTEAQLSKEPEGEPKEGLLEGMKQGLAAMLIPTLIEKLDGAALTITKKEMIVTTKQGTGTAEGYEIIERPDPNTWRVKTAGGKVETYTREGERLSSPASGDVHFKAYFRRAEK